jgi:cytochrome P450
MSHATTTPPPPPLKGPPRRPEDPGGLRGRLAFLTFARDPLGFVEQLARAHPGAARLPMPGGAFVYLTDLDAIGDLLLDRERVFVKDWNTRVLGAVLGQGLFTSEGELWRRQRSLIAPALQRKQIAAYVAIAARRAAAYADSVRDGEVRDVKPDMTRLTMEVVAEALFGADIGPAAGRVAGALEEALRAFEQLIYSWRRFVPASWDQPVRRRLAAASADLDGVVGEIVARKRAAPGGDDLLSRLIGARDEAGGAMSDRQLRDEVVTMLLAGHETTAMALAFALWFLARHPAWAARIADTGDDAAAAVFKETLRLQPPVWLFGREAQRDAVVGRWQIRRGEQVLVSPWLVHRDPRWFERPGDFLPERWLEGLDDRLPRHAYLPFGSGPRVCAGMHFALMEGTVVLSALCRRWRLHPAGAADDPLEVSPAITLRPRRGVRIAFSRSGTGPERTPPA